jgi:hypothetical protein
MTATRTPGTKFVITMNPLGLHRVVPVDLDQAERMKKRGVKVYDSAAQANTVCGKMRLKKRKERR